MHSIGKSKVGKNQLEIACIDVNQLMAKNSKEEGIRKHLIEYKGLKQIDGKIPLPQIVVNHQNISKRFKDLTKKCKEGIPKVKCTLDDKTDSNRKGKKASSTNDRMSICIQAKNKLDCRRPSFEDKECSKVK